MESNTGRRSPNPRHFSEKTQRRPAERRSFQFVQCQSEQSVEYVVPSHIFFENSSKIPAFILLFDFSDFQSFITT